MAPHALLPTLLLLAAAGCSDGGAPSGSGGGDGGQGGEAPSYPPPYTIPALDGARITSDQSAENFQQVAADVDFHDGPFASVKLVIDLSSTCYPFEQWQANPPPDGESWPADCDAFDRNFEFTLDEPASPDQPPAIELVRAITPFGGPLHLEVDITDVANGLPGHHRLRAFIATWSDAAGQVSGSNGGWNVSASIDATPGPPPRKVLAVVPIFNGSQDTPESPAPIAFQVPEGTIAGRLEYRATGHGGGQSGHGCIGPAEEFCHRTHTLSIDGAPIAEVDPWRTDCDDLCTITHYGPADGGFDYCQENPCGSIQSVKAPRANWCPGSETPPFTWEAEAPTSPGPHTFSWGINTVASGGVWRLSAHYIAFGE
jgi:hypothetical protein